MTSPLDAVLEPRDTPPERVGDGTVLYHGTTAARAARIVAERAVTASPGWGAGVCTTRRAAMTYACIKAVGEQGDPAVVRLLVRNDWLRLRRIEREVGGSGRDQFLVRADIGPDALLAAEVHPEPAAKEDDAETQPRATT